MTDFVPQLTGALLDAFRVLARVPQNAEFATALFQELGVEVELGASEADALRQVLPSLGRIEAELLPLAERIAAGDSLSIADAATIAEIVAAVYADLDAIAGATSPGNLAGLPAPLDDPATWTGLATAIPDALIGSWLESALPAMYLPLRLGGVIRTPIDAAGRRRRETNWGTLTSLISDPAGSLSAEYGWDDGFDHMRLLAALRDVATALGLRLLWTEPASPSTDEWYPDGLPWGLRALRLELAPSPLASLGGAATIAVEALPIPAAPGGAPGGVGLSNLSTLEAGVSIELAPEWTAELTGAVDASGALVAELLPASGLSLSGGETSIDLGVEVRGEPAAPWTLIGSADGPRITLAGLSLAARLSGPADEPEIILELAATGDGMRCTLPAGTGDSFLASVIDGEVAGGATFELAWSSLNGVTLNGSVNLALKVPVGLNLGLLLIDELELSIEPGATASLDLRLTITVVIGPFTAQVEGLGLQAIAAASPDGDGAFGPFDLTLVVLPPRRLAFDMEAEAVRGGGFLEIEDDRYVGGLSLDVLTVGIDAFTIIDTSLPDDPDGFALFATLTLRFPSVPLGFGFALSGLGGILALNRGIDAEALALGLRDGAADAVLFPSDPLRDADLLAAQLDEYFPLLGGNTVVGPVAEISWGVGEMITGELGVVVSLPQGQIVVLGSIEAILPDPNAPVLELHLDTLGALDPAEGTLLVVASLYDSRLLGVIELSGDAALYVSWLEDPYFLLSVGGYHPGFQPPAHVPAVLETLRRMRAEVLIGLGVTASVEAYFAVTSNTVQFGGGFEIEASADFLLVTYTARGWFEFDVLFRFSPFLIMADASAGVGVYANDKELLGVQLAVHLEGPEPWYASGNASFKFFGVKVKFDFAVGGYAPPALPPTTDVLVLIEAELANPAAWTTAPAVGVVAGLQFAGAETETLLRPDDRLLGRQTVAPFGHHLARFGETAPLQTEVNVTSTSVVDGISGEAIGGLDVEDELDWFAPAQYDVMQDAARLSAPSYEQMAAGVGIGAPGTGLPEGDRIAAPAGHETEVWEPLSNKVLALGSVRAVRESLDQIAASAGARTASEVSGTAVDVDRVDLAAQSYVVVDAATGEATSGALSYGTAVLAADAADRRVVPSHAGNLT